MTTRWLAAGSRFWEEVREARKTHLSVCPPRSLAREFYRQCSGSGNSSHFRWWLWVLGRYQRGLKWVWMSQQSSPLSFRLNLSHDSWNLVTFEPFETWWHPKHLEQNLGHTQCFKTFRTCWRLELDGIQPLVTFKFQSYPKHFEIQNLAAETWLHRELGDIQPWWRNWMNLIELNLIYLI